MTDRDLKTEELLQALSQVKDPVSGQDVVSAGRVEGLTHCEGAVKVTIHSQTPAPPVLDALRTAAEAALQAIAWVSDVNLKVEGPQPGGEDAPAGGGGIGLGKAKHAIAVGSGKGGVGKSTVAVNIAAALARAGHRVGLLDADIYGPSIPTMLGVHEQPRVVESDGRKLIAPLVAHGIELMSMGFLVEPEKPMIWRGPMLHGALKQFFNDVAWNEVDYLLIDLPPGTGDVALTLVQNIQLAGAIIVSTPQEVAMVDARKALGMFEETKVEVLGIVENMAGEVFGQGGAETWAKSKNVPFLGSVPLDARIRAGGDEGRPAALAEEPEVHGVWRSIADGLHERLGQRGEGRRRISLKR